MNVPEGYTLEPYSGASFIPALKGTEMSTGIEKLLAAIAILEGRFNELTTRIAAMEEHGDKAKEFVDVPDVQQRRKDCQAGLGDYFAGTSRRHNAGAGSGLKTLILGRRS